MALGGDIDPDGNDMVVRYSRKTQENYLRAEEEGKSKGYSLWYRNGKWVDTA